MTKVVASVQLSSFRLDKVQIGSILERVMYLVHRHHILLDPAFTSMLTAIVVLEGVGRQLTPDLDIFKTSLPIIAKADRQYKMAVGQAVMETFKRRTSSS
jgi:aarF domain-containing kinase